MKAASTQGRILSYSIRILLLVAFGTIGYMVIEKWTFLDAVWMTVNMLATVGYGELKLDDNGRIFTIFFILAGVGVFLSIVGNMVQLLLEANPTAIFGRRYMKRQINGLSGHKIVCGYGRTGQEVANHFKDSSVPFLVIEQDPVRAKRAELDGMLIIQGDATADETLREAKIEAASGIVCTLPDDTANTFIALAASELNTHIHIVSRSGNPGSEAKMLRAGAQKVISPYVICGRRMATAVTHPLVLEFLDVAMHTPGYDLRLEQVTLSRTSSLVGMSLKDANVKQISGAMILAVGKHGKLITNPPPDHIFVESDELIALGTEEQLRKLSELAGAPIPEEMK